MSVYEEFTEEIKKIVEKYTSFNIKKLKRFGTHKKTLLLSISYNHTPNIKICNLFYAELYDAFHALAKDYDTYFKTREYLTDTKYTIVYYFNLPIEKDNEFKVNDYITLKLVRRQTKIFINDKEFTQCKFLLFNFDKNELRDYEEIDSIDEIREKYDNTHESNPQKLDPKVEFWGHCSNIQAWAENDYDSRLLDMRLAFPMLRRLTKVRDPIAEQVFKEEVANRLESNHLPTIVYLFENHYTKGFNTEEFRTVLQNINFNKIKNSIHQNKQYEDTIWSKRILGHIFWRLREITLNTKKCCNSHLTFLKAFPEKEIYFCANCYQVQELYFDYNLKDLNIKELGDITSVDSKLWTPILSDKIFNTIRKAIIEKKQCCSEPLKLHKVSMPYRETYICPICKQSYGLFFDDKLRDIKWERYGDLDKWLNPSKVFPGPIKVKLTKNQISYEF